MKTKLRHPSNRVLIFVLLLVIAIQVGIMWSYGNRINALWESVMGHGTSQQQINNSLGGIPVKLYIQDAIKGLYTNGGVVDVTQNRVYFPEMKISLPMSQEARDLRYNYTAADNNNPAQANLHSAPVLDNLVSDFSQIQCAQKVASLSFDNLIPKQTPSDKIGLDDGRVMYLYPNSAAGCPQFWGSNLSQQTVDLLKQAQSY